MSTTPPITAWVPKISADPKPDEIHRLFTLAFQKLGNHATAFGIQQAKINSIKAGVSNTIIQGGGSGGGGSIIPATPGGIPVNNQSGETSYATASTDDGALILLSDAGPITVTLTSQSPPWSCFIANQSAIGGGSATLTPASGMINGVATFVLPPSYFALVAYNGTNWFAAATLPIVPISFGPISHEFLTGYNAATGAFSAAQPAFTDISGIAASSQLPTPTTSAIGGVEAINAIAHEWINSINTSGVPQLSRPAFTDISGVATTGQIGTGTPAAGKYVDGGTGAWTALPVVNNYHSVTSSSYSSTASDRIIGVNYAGSVAISLINASSVPSGTVIVVKDESGNAGTNNITITPQSGQTIEGASNQVIVSGYDDRRMYSNGSSKWFLI